jgi:hypothetical protein
MPLGKLFVAKSYNTRRNVEKTTKTDAVKHVPVHPVLAAMLAEWKLGGWAEMVGYAPGPGDLIVPLPRMPPSVTDHATVSRSVPTTTPVSGGATSMDGADPEVIETRVTHTQKARSSRSPAPVGSICCVSLQSRKVQENTRIKSAPAAVVQTHGGYA